MTPKMHWKDNIQVSSKMASQNEHRNTECYFTIHQSMLKLG